jgi:hypothetical protein
MNYVSKYSKHNAVEQMLMIPKAEFESASSTDRNNG